MRFSIQSVKGMHDVLPDKEPLLAKVEQEATRVLQSFGYQKIRLPILEKTDLFKRSIGDDTDIVEKEMYSFVDAGDERLSLRPEGTASCVRACLQHGLIGKGQIRRVCYQGPFFRRERPQQGRYRQFYQIGAESFGDPSPDTDAELLLLTGLLWEQLNLKNKFVLKLNTLGSPADRKRYRSALTDYLSAHREKIDDTARRRIETNPLRVLDSKDSSTKQVVADAPDIREFLSDETRAHYERLKDILCRAKLTFEEDGRLVRGLDYYTGVVFEWIALGAGAQNTVCAGGRYDGLVEQLGGAPTPAAGFAVGVDRVALAMGEDTVRNNEADIYIAAIGEQAKHFVPGFGVDIRRKFPALHVVTHCGDGSIKAQMRRADKSGAKAALIFGDNEIAEQTVVFKPLSSGQEQENLPIDRAMERISTLTSIDN